MRVELGEKNILREKKEFSLQNQERAMLRKIENVDV